MEELLQETTLEAELQTPLSENVTVVEGEYWRTVLNTVNTVIMTSNTISLMLGMGAAISVIDVRPEYLDHLEAGVEE